MAEIYLARATTELGGVRLSVVKQILPELSGNEKFADMLTGEAKLAARLSHANIVQVFDLGRHEEILFIAMEYVEGFDLNDLLRRCARSKIPFPVDFGLLVVLEVLRGLGYAHRLSDDDGTPIGIVHRDVSPSNILISFEGEVKLCDFGIARANNMSDLLSEDVVKGKAGYMSPEQARGRGLDARADLFAAGIVLWELLAGHKLYKEPKAGKGPTVLDLAQIAEIPSLPARGLPNEAALHGIVFKSLSRDCDDRYPNAQAMLRDLENYVGKSRLMASPIRFGEWLRENFGEKVIASRRARERAAKAIEQGPVPILEAHETLLQPHALGDEQSGERKKPTRPEKSTSSPDETIRSTRPEIVQAKSNLLFYLGLCVGLGVAIIVLLWVTTLKR